MSSAELSWICYTILICFPRESVGVCKSPTPRVDDESKLSRNRTLCYVRPIFWWRKLTHMAIWSMKHLSHFFSSRCLSCFFVFHFTCIISGSSGPCIFEDLFPFFLGHVGSVCFLPCSSFGLILAFLFLGHVGSLSLLSFSPTCLVHLAFLFLGHVGSVCFLPCSSFGLMLDFLFLGHVGPGFSFCCF